MPEQQTTNQPPRGPSIKEGVHKAKPVKVGIKGDDKKVQILVQFVITDGPDSGKHIVWFGGASTEKAVKYTRGILMEVLEWKEEDFDRDFESWIPPAVEVSLNIEHRDLPATPTNPAKRVASVKYINRGDGRGNAMEKMSATGSAAKTLQSMFKAKITGSTAPTGGETKGFDDGVAVQDGEDPKLPF